MTKALQLARALVPELSPSLHKGQAGMCVPSGCRLSGEANEIKQEG